MQAVDFNSDMGEGFGPWTIGDGVDAELMAYISSANIATGFHAGDPGTMRRTVARAKQLGVAIGAHPGWMIDHFGATSGFWLALVAGAVVMGSAVLGYRRLG